MGTFQPQQRCYGICSKERRSRWKVNHPIEKRSTFLESTKSQRGPSRSIHNVRVCDLQSHYTPAEEGARTHWKCARSTRGCRRLRQLGDDFAECGGVWASASSKRQQLALQLREIENKKERKGGRDEESSLNGSPSEVGRIHRPRVAILLCLIVTVTQEVWWMSA